MTKGVLTTERRRNLKGPVVIVTGRKEGMGGG